MVILKDKPCETCGTTKYRRSASGQYVCKYGHLLSGWQEETHDESFWMGRTRANTGAVDKTDKKSDNSRFQGLEKEALILRVSQHALMLMARSFVHDLGFPAEFEYIVRELWLLYVSTTNKSFPDSFLPYQEEEAATAIPSTFLATEGDTLEEDFDIDLTLDDNSGAGPSKISNDSNAEQSDTKTNQNTSKWVPKWPQYLAFDSIVFCYLTALWLQCPVLLSDIRRWCLTLKLPYLKVPKSLPPSIHGRINAHYMLSFLAIPSTTELYRRAYTYKKCFSHFCKLNIPNGNTPMLLLRMCTQFFLPTEAYFAGLQLIGRIKYQFSRRGGPSIYTVVPKFDEVAAVICVLILVKLCYLLDDDPTDTDFLAGIQSLEKKETWLERIQRNAERWRDMQDHRHVQTDDIELSLLLNFLNDAAFVTINKENRSENKLQQYIERLNKELGLDNYLEKHPPKTPDLYMVHQDFAEYRDRHFTFRRRTLLTENVRVVGNYFYRMSSRQRIFTKEYDMVLRLASSILDLEFDFLHRLVSKCELLLRHSLQGG